MRSTKVAIAIHIITLVELCPDKKITSTLISKSINTNPVVIRRIMGELKKGGIIRIHPGNQGIALVKRTNEITLFDLYEILETGQFFLRSHNKSNQMCPIGAVFDQAVNCKFKQIQSDFEKKLQDEKISVIIDNIKRNGVKMSLLNNAKNLYIEGIEQGNYESALSKYIGAEYKQHSTGVADGIDGFIAFFSEFLKRSPERQFDIIHGFEEGNMAFVFVLQTINGEKSWLTMDMFLGDDEHKIIEHWDIIEAYKGPKQIAGEFEFTSNEYDLKEIILNNKDNLNNLIGDKNKRDEVYNFNQVEIHQMIRFDNYVATLIGFTDQQDYAAMQLFKFNGDEVIDYFDLVEVIVPLTIAKNSGKF